MANDLGKLNDILFAELDRLEQAGADDIAAEAERAKQVRDLAGTVIDNARTVITAYKLRSDAELMVGGAVKEPPKMLGGGE